LKDIPVGGVLAVALTIGGCASGPSWDCRPPEQPAILDTLYFGTDGPDGMITPEQWKNFLDQVVTPRFPGGLTSWDASGQWRTAEGVILREVSHVLHIVHPDDRESESALDEIMSRYKMQFRQEAVLRVRSRGCLSY
jgi:hypothetical protein